MIPDDEYGYYLAKQSVIKKKKKCICFMNINARLFCDAHPRLHVIRNDVEQVTLDVGFISSSPGSSKSSDIVVLPCKLIEL